jgi:23S rRNA (guanosine2251-2'-O)-methyltransferase
MSELIYGRRAVLETLRARRRRIYRLWLEGDKEPKEGSSLADIMAEAKAQNIATRAITGGLFDKLKREQSNAQGVALEVGDYPYATVDDCFAHARAQGEPPLFLLLDHLEDPQNLGTLIRTADALGVHGIVIPDRRAARVTPAVSNASAGAVEHTRIVQVTNLNRTIDDLKERNVWVAGLAGEPEVPPLEQANLSGAMAIVVGSEGKGLSRLTREKCDFLVRLTMTGNVESLNASVAGSIVLYAARQARRT